MTFLKKIQPTNNKKLIRLFCATIAVFCSISFSFPIYAQDMMRIVAIVNDDIITFYDVNERMKLVNLSNKIPNDPNSRKLAADQILRALIDENIKLQESLKQNVRISDREIQKQIDVIAQNNNMTRDKFNAFLASKNINITSMFTQIHSQIAWTKTLTKTVRRKIQISDEEIDEEIARLESSKNNSQKRVFDIFIPLDGSGNNVAARRLVQDLLDKLAAGENFSSLARNYSQSSNASVGGDLGWVSAGQLSEELNEVVKELNPSSPPAVVKLVTGFHIILVKDERSLTANIDDTKFDLSQVIVPLDKSLNQENRTDIADYLLNLAQQSPVCGLTEENLTPIEGAKIASPKGVRLGDLSPAIKLALTPIQTGQMIKPLIIGDTLIHITVCKRIEATSNLPSRQEINNNIGQQRLELLARQYLRDLRNTAYIDVRM